MLPGVGVLDHQQNPTLEDVLSAGRSAEEAGADWFTVSDNTTWRDTWMMSGALAGVTERILVGPGVTNPYLRHPFHTVAALATLHDISAGRAMLGVGAGGSLLTDVIGLDRSDAPTRVAELIELVRNVAGGAPLDEGSGRALNIDLPPTPVLTAGRKDGMLRCGGAHADSVLVFRIPMSDIDRVIGVIGSGASDAGRDKGPDIVWCPLVAWDERIRPHLRTATVYAALESPPELFDGWGVDPATRGEIRAVVHSKGLPAAAELMPDAIVDDIILADADPAAVAATAKRIGATRIAIRNFSNDALPTGVEWARAVTANLNSPG